MTIPLRARIAAHRSGHEYDFLHLPSLLAMIERTRPEGAEAPEPGPYSARPLPELPESVDLRNVHVVGHQLSRVWASGLLAHHGDAQARADLNGLVDAVLARGDLWSDDFTVVSHWVPQYIYIALWMAAGAP